MKLTVLFAAAVVAGFLPIPTFAQQAVDKQESVEPVDGITVLFSTGGSSLRDDQRDQLDRAARLFRDGNPVVMVVTGTADTIGDPVNNLDLSIRRARAVAAGLVDRGIPVERLQVLGQGNSELPVVTDDEVSNAKNRSAHITWR